MGVAKPAGTAQYVSSVAGRASSRLTYIRDDLPEAEISRQQFPRRSSSVFPRRPLPAVERALAKEDLAQDKNLQQVAALSAVS